MAGREGCQNDVKNCQEDVKSEVGCWAAHDYVTRRPLVPGVGPFVTSVLRGLRLLG
jgi:hypothetical protein